MNPLHLPARTLFRRASKGGLSLALLLAVAPTASGVGFGAVIIAQTGDATGIFSFNDFGFFVPGQSPAPSINAGGEVAFWAATEDGLEEGIFKGAGAGLTPIAHTNAAFVELGQLPSIDYAGMVAFRGRDSSAVVGDGFGVWKGDGGALHPVLANSDGYSYFGDPSLNDNGRVVSFGQNDSQSALLSVALGSITPIAMTSGALFDEFPGYPYVGVPSLNNNARLTFYAITDLGDPGIFETRSTGGLPVNTLVDTSLDLNDFRDPVISDSGRVAFWAAADDFTGERILFWENGELHTVVDTLVSNSFEFKELGDPAQNNDGSIAFWALLADGSEGIFFVDTLGEISRVLGTGDALQGSTIEELGLGNKGLNSQGDMAIWAMLADGSEVILRTVDVCPLDPRHDTDGDGVCGNIDNCPKISNSAQADIDRDGVGDACDNCTLIPNGPTALDAGGASQRDGDGDGYGNACDADFDQNNVVNFGDLAAMKKVFFKTDLVADLNGDGVVNFSDLAILKKAFFKPPGPAAGKP